MTSTTSAQALPNTQEMVVIHRVFRRELAAIPGLARAVASGDAARVRVVAEHTGFVLGFLHAHHSGEDELLWPLLLRRAAPAAALVHTMQEQHHGIEERADAAAEALRAWSATLTAAAGERLAAAVDGLREALLVHLDLEEREILPLVTRHVSAAEWAALAEHGKNATPRRQLPLVFGAMLEGATADERAALLAAVPAPIRFFLRTAGARQYRTHVTRLRAG
ncbi:hemerythrin domain-containing protein [Dactylosporangium sp. CA-233914]|uniref:hemerythrin domain-containing protein n=1 Tax=Dactylosporangium sp. CA-233914 TaxID=3239934 RepID=UPI003D90377A